GPHLGTPRIPGPRPGPGKQQDRTPGRKRPAERLPHQGEHHLQPGGAARPVTQGKRSGPFLRGRAPGTPEDPDPPPHKTQGTFPPPGGTWSFCTEMVHTTCRTLCVVRKGPGSRVSLALEERVWPAETMFGDPRKP